MVRLSIYLTAAALCFSSVLGAVVPNAPAAEIDQTHQPRSVGEIQHDLQERGNKHLKRVRKAVVKNSKITFYSGGQLKDPFCGEPTPNDHSFIAAVSADSPFKCGDHIKISAPDGKSTTVKVIDRCAACTSNWIDVTKGVFEVFDSLDTGVLHGITLTKV